MKSRIELQVELESILGTRNVYFQPPETVKIGYPAIIYNLNGINVRNADNFAYMKGRNYTVILIHKNPDNDIVEKMLDHFKYCSMERSYTYDNLYHYVYNLYF